MKGHRIVGEYHIIYNRSTELWYIYKYWNSGNEKCQAWYHYLKDAVKWCQDNP